MDPCVGPNAPSFGRQLCGLPSRVQYLSPQGVLLPLVYGTTASPLWLELRGRSAWQATPSRTVYRLTSHRLLPWLRLTFAMVPDAAWLGSDEWPWSTAPATGPLDRLGPPGVSDPWGVGSFLSLGRPTCVRCPGPLGSCSPVCPLGALRCFCGVLGHLAPVHQCARSQRCFACAVFWATWLLFTGVPAWFVALRVRCPGPLGSCSPVRPLGVLCCVWGVLGHLAPVHQCAWPWFPVPLLSSVLVHRRARCFWSACAVGGCVSLLLPLIFFRAISFFSFEKINKKVFKNLQRRGRVYTAGTSMSNWCSGAIVLCSLACVVGALVAPAPQGCGSRVLMYTDMGYGGLVWCLFALGAGWLGGRVGCGCGLWLRCSLDGPC